jgi:N-glycosylase/DNA lyase
MNRDSIEAAKLVSGVGPQSTLESAQTFLWDRVDGESHDEPDDHGDAWYCTVAGDDVAIASRRRDGPEWRATTDADVLLRRRLPLDDGLDAIFATLPAGGPRRDLRHPPGRGATWIVRASGAPGSR